MKAQFFFIILLVSQVAFALPSKKKQSLPKKKEVIVKKTEPCATPTPDPLKKTELTPDTIKLQGLGSSAGCKLKE